MRSRLDRPKPWRRVGWGYGLFIGGIVVVVALIVLVTVLYYTSRQTLEGCTVDSKDRSVSVTSDGDGNVTSQTSHRVYTDCGVFVVEDDLFLLKFNSADTYGSLKDGQKYDLDVIGWRNGFLSWFPNILSAEEAS